MAEDVSVNSEASGSDFQVLHYSDFLSVHLKLCSDKLS